MTCQINLTTFVLCYAGVLTISNSPPPFHPFFLALLYIYIYTYIHSCYVPPRGLLISKISECDVCLLAGRHLIFAKLTRICLKLCIYRREKNFSVNEHRYYLIFVKVEIKENVSPFC